MKRVLFSFWSILCILGIFLMSCTSEEIQTFFDEEIQALDFTASTTIDGETTQYRSDQAIEICEGESITFNVIDHLETDYSYSWSFQGSSNDVGPPHSITVTYEDEGKYNVTLTTSDGNSTSVDRIATEYVCVVAKEPEPEGICLIESEETNDGFRTEFEYDGEILTAANKYFNGVIQERSEYTYNALNQLVQEQFLNALNELLGNRFLIYNSADQLIMEITEAADGSLVRERTWAYNPGVDLPVSAMYKESDNAGGFVTFEVEIVADLDGVNIIEERFSLGGAYAGSNFYEFDNNEKVLANIDIEMSPLRFNLNNVMRITSVDESGSPYLDISSSYVLPEQNVEFNDPCEPRPIERSDFVDGLLTRTYTYTYRVVVP